MGDTDYLQHEVQQQSPLENLVAADGSAEVTLTPKGLVFWDPLDQRRHHFKASCSRFTTVTSLMSAALQSSAKALISGNANMEINGQPCLQQHNPWLGGGDKPSSTSPFHLFLFMHKAIHVSRDRGFEDADCEKMSNLPCLKWQQKSRRVGGVCAFQGRVRTEGLDM